jgi:hypothetical protein
VAQRQELPVLVLELVLLASTVLVPLWGPGFIGMRSSWIQLNYRHFLLACRALLPTASERAPCATPAPRPRLWSSVINTRTASGGAIQPVLVVVVLVLLVVLTTGHYWPEPAMTS